MTHPYEIRQRYLGLKKSETIQTNSTIDNQFKRRTIRSYDPNKKLDKDQIQYLISAAQCSPNSSGASSWGVVVLTTQEEKQAFLDTCGDAISAADPINYSAILNCSAFLIWIADNNKSEKSIRAVANKEVGEEIAKTLSQRLPNRAPGLRNLDINNNPFFDADNHIEYLNQGYYTLRSMIDATIAAQTFVVCAESLNLGTMYIGSVAHCTIKSFVQTLGLPKRTYPIFGLCVGFEHPAGTDQNGVSGSENLINWLNSDPTRKIKPLAPIETVLHWGKYNQESLIRGLHKHNEILWKFTSEVTPRRPSDYMTARVTCRIQQAHDQIKLMEYMGLLFGPTRP